jgi:hypothetical protein
MVAWLKSWFNSEDKQTDIKLLAFVVVVGWSIYKLNKADLDANWTNSFYGLCALVGLGGSALSAVEKWKGGGTNV